MYANIYYYILPVYDILLYTYIYIYIYIYIYAIKNITIRTAKQKTGETSDDDFLQPLNIFCLDKWLGSLIKWVHYNILK